MTEVQNDFVWIKTRDGFPTLWNQNLGESYRSLKGAFLESWHVFVGPSLKHQKKLASGITGLGEFGLGAGTNWVLWNLSQKFLNLNEVPYFCIENDLKSFHLGRQKWINLEKEVNIFLYSKLIEEKFINSDFPQKIFSIADLAAPLVSKSLTEFHKNNPKVDLWFHDPFGFEVNPEGYSEETLLQCKQLLSIQARAFSYACNSRFQKSLKSAGFNFELLPSDPHGKLKRERIEFF